MGIYQKILEVQKEVDSIPKSGYNAFNKYKYCTEADVLSVKALMNKHGLVAFPDVVGYETLTRGDSIQVIQHVEYTVVDVESGEQITCKVLGQGEDKGDKGSYKAATGANKYFYLKFTGAPTGDDPEKEDGAPKKASGQPTKAVAARPVPAPPSPHAEANALIKKILEIQTNHGFSEDDVKTYGECSSLKEAQQKNDIAGLRKCHTNLLQLVHTRQKEMAGG